MSRKVGEWSLFQKEIKNKNLEGRLFMVEVLVPFIHFGFNDFQDFYAIINGSSSRPVLQMSIVLEPGSGHSSAPNVPPSAVSHHHPSLKSKQLMAQEQQRPSGLALSL